MTSFVIVSALLERLQELPDLFPEGNSKREHITNVNGELLQIRAIRQHLNQIIGCTDVDRDNELIKRFERELMKASYSLEDALESYPLEISSRGKGLTRSYQSAIDDMRKALAGISIQLGEIKPPEISQPQRHDDPAARDEEGSSSGQDQSLSYHGISRATSRVAADIDLIGKEDDEKALISALIEGSKELTVVSICGVGGAGKTTLAHRVYNSDSIVCHFHVRAWCCVSQFYSTRQILLDILSEILCVRPEIVDMGTEDLSELVYQHLKGNKWLIVLDDIWSIDAWDSISLAFPRSSYGSRILLTTRNRDVALQAGGFNAYIHEMSFLTDGEAWELLRRNVLFHDPSIVIDGEMEQIGREIAKRCHGLPLALVAAAGILSIKAPYDWSEVLQSLDVYPGADQGSGVLTASRVLHLSYKHLPLDMKPCFIYLGIFPEDTAIEIDTLCQLWMAEGLLCKENRRDGETLLMKIAAKYLGELAARSLVRIDKNQISRGRRIKVCYIHALFRDLCIATGREDEIFDIIDSGQVNQPITSSARRRAVYLNKFDFKNFVLSERADYFRSLLFFNSFRSGKEFIWPKEVSDLNNFHRLRVLYFSFVDFKDGKLPKGVEKLVYLRYLGFRDCYLAELPSSISNLVYLQTLDLRVRNECEMTISCVFHKMKRLRFLYLPLAYGTPKRERLRLNGLEELEILENFDTAVCNALDLLELTKLRKVAVIAEGDPRELTEISKWTDRNSNPFRRISLHIRNFDCYSEGRLSILHNLFRSGSLRTLGVEEHIGKLPEPENISEKLTGILLSGSELDEDPMQILGKLPKLRILVLEIEAYLGTKMQCCSGTFPELRYLKLSKLYELEEWEVESEAPPKLSSLVIENCRKLRALPELSNVSLEKLEIASMPTQFVRRIRRSDGTEGKDFHKIGKVNIIIDGQKWVPKKKPRRGEDVPSTSVEEMSVKESDVKRTMMMTVGEKDKLKNELGKEAVTEKSVKKEGKKDEKKKDEPPMWYYGPRIQPSVENCMRVLDQMQTIDEAHFLHMTAELMFCENMECRKGWIGKFGRMAGPDQLEREMRSWIVSNAKKLGLIKHEKPSFSNER